MTAEVAWVSEDSVSMVYEALTGGARVGLLALPPRGGTGRVLRGLDRLLTDGWVTTHAHWCEEGALPPPRLGFDEAARCARLILERSNHRNRGYSPRRLGELRALPGHR